MPITAETFELEHFEVLRRGLDAAEGALRLRDEEVEKLTEQIDVAKDARDEEVDQLKDALSEKPTAEEWGKLIEFIVDVDRGVRDFPELIAWLRDQEYIEPR